MRAVILDRDSDTSRTEGHPRGYVSNKGHAARLYTENLPVCGFAELSEAATWHVHGAKSVPHSRIAAPARRLIGISKDPGTSHDGSEFLSHLQVGRACAMTGEGAKARAAYQDFFSLWKDAESDIPILEDAKSEFANLQ